MDNHSDLFVSEQSGRTLPEDVPFDAIRWHRVRLSSPGIEAGIHRLMRERDEAGEQVCFLVDRVDLELMRGVSPLPVSPDSTARWSRFHVSPARRGR